MKIKLLLLTILIALSGYFVWHREGPFEAEAQQLWLAKEMSGSDHNLRGISNTVKNIPDIGTYIHNIAIERGIRAISGEVAGPGEVKISLNLAWQSIPENPLLRDVLDQTAAYAITEVFSQHREISKIRVIVKIPKKRKNVNGQRLGRSMGYKNAAKVFSITRVAWNTALQYDKHLYDPVTIQGAANILSLGDYVILTDAGWARGY